MAPVSRAVSMIVTIFLASALLARGLEVVDVPPARISARSRRADCGAAGKPCCPDGTCNADSDDRSSLSCQERNGKAKCLPCGRGKQPPCGPPGSAPAVTCPTEPMDVFGTETSYPGVFAVDAEDGELTPVCSPATGDIAPGTTASVTCTATDSDGREATCSLEATRVRECAAKHIVSPTSDGASETPKASVGFSECRAAGGTYHHIFGRLEDTDQATCYTECMRSLQEKYEKPFSYQCTYGMERPIPAPMVTICNLCVFQEPVKACAVLTDRPDQHSPYLPNPQGNFVTLECNCG